MFIPSQGPVSFSGPVSKKAGGAQEIGRAHSQDRWPELAKGIFHTIERRAEYISWGKKKGETFGIMAFVLPSNH